MIISINLWSTHTVIATMHTTNMITTKTYPHVRPIATHISTSRFDITTRIFRTFIIGIDTKCGSERL